MDDGQRQQKAKPAPYGEEITLPIKTVLFEFSRRHGQTFSDGALLVLSLIYKELDRLPRLTWINKSNLATRIGRSRSAVDRALNSACKVGLAKKVETTNRGVAYRLFDPRLVALEQQIDPSDPQLRLPFVDVLDDEDATALRVVGTIGGDESVHGSGTGSVQLELMDPDSVHGHVYV